MNAPLSKFAIMRANREKRRQVEAYGRMLDSIERNALGVQSQGPAFGRPMIRPLATGVSHVAPNSKEAVDAMRPLLAEWGKS